MILTASYAARSYAALCRTLERNDITFAGDDRRLCVRCKVSGRDIEQNYIFNIDPSKMLITLYSTVPVRVGQENLGDMALALCMINNTISDGSFCIDIGEGILYFKMTVSFYESTVSDTVFEYMLSTAADTIDEYYPGLHRLAG